MCVWCVFIYTCVCMWSQRFGYVQFYIRSKPSTGDQKKKKTPETRSPVLFIVRARFFLSNFDYSGCHRCIHTDRHQCFDMFLFHTRSCAYFSRLCVPFPRYSISLPLTPYHYRGPYLSKIDFIVSTGAKKNTQSIARSNVWRGGPVKMYDTSDR